MTKAKDKLKNKKKNKNPGVTRTNSEIKKLLEITYIRTADKTAHHLTLNIDNSLL